MLLSSRYPHPHLLFNYFAYVPAFNSRSMIEVFFLNNYRQWILCDKRGSIS